MPARDVTLFMALIKKDINRERREKILIEAAKQSGRATVPILGEVMSISDVLANNKTSLVDLDPLGTLPALEYFITNVTSPVGLLVGPESGFTDEEISLFHTKNVPIVITGPTILRAETAAIVALSLVLIV